MKCVAILLSTYNGAKYIRQQIESILHQTYDNITLIIRDDGSTDETIAIVRELISENTSKKQIMILEDEAGNVGFAESFKRLVVNADGYDYYAFCDQDDCWAKDKVEKAVKKLSKHEKEAALYTSAYWVCDDALNIKYVHEVCDDLCQYKLAQLFMEARIAGFTVVFTGRLRQEAFLKGTIPQRLIYSHDKWIILVVVGLNLTYICDHAPDAYYRRHAHTESPFEQTLVKRVIWRIRHTFREHYLKDILIMINTYRTIYGNDVKREEDREFLEKFSQDGIRGRMARAFYPKRMREKLIDEICLRGLLIVTSIK